MPPTRAKALDVSNLRASHQGMVPHTPNSVPGPWPVYRREFDNPAEEPGHSAAYSQHYSTNPGYGLPSPRVVCLHATFLECLGQGQEALRLSCTLACYLFTTMQHYAGAHKLSMARCHDTTCFRRCSKLCWRRSRQKDKQLSCTVATASLHASSTIIAVPRVFCS